MKVLITGANGRIGHNLVQWLADKHELVLLGQQPKASLAGHKYHQVDMTDKAQLNEVMAKEKPEAIVHLAALLASTCASDPELAHKINVNSSEYLAELATANRVRVFVFASSSAVYNQTELAPTDEEHNVDPKSVYGKTKLLAEKKLMAVSEHQQTKFISLRLFNIYGADFNESLVYQLLHSTKEKPTVLFGPNNFYRDYVHISDICAAFEHSLSADTSPYEVLNIASGKVLNNQQLVEELGENGASIYFEIKKNTPLSISWANIGQSERVINWQPHTEIRGAIEEIINAR